MKSSAEVPSRASVYFYRFFLFVGIAFPFFGVVVAIMLLWQHQVTWLDMTLFISMYVLTGLGITVGYHRMLTHRSFETYPVVRFIFLALGSMAAQGTATYWASTHIQHHTSSDSEGDPHSPVQGFLHGHIGWMFAPFVPNPDVYGTWLLKDPMVAFFTRTFALWVVLGFFIPFLIGGWSGLLWGGLVRMFLLHHVTWSVNSICHMFGTQMFQSNDQSRNNLLIGLLAFGEGWHNNHHTFPRSAFHGMRWWQIDVSSYVIQLLEKLGLAWNVQRISPAAMEKRLIQKTPS
jgi:stearoyl-CoA desaturase (delta-9 desaturase)